MAQIIRRAELRDEPFRLTYAEAFAPPIAEAALRESEPPAPPEPVVEPTAEATPALVEPAGTSLEALRKQAFEDGYRDGREAGEKQAREELAGEAAALARLCASAQQALEGEIGGLEDIAVEIAFAAVCKMLGAAAASEEALRGMVRQAIDGVRLREKVRVRVSPEDHARLAALADPLPGELVADERVALGGCIVESGGGALDARLEVQLRQLVVTLTAARNGHAR